MRDDRAKETTMIGITYRTRTNSKGYYWQRKEDCIEMGQVVGTIKGEQCANIFPSSLDEVPEELRHELFLPLTPSEEASELYKKTFPCPPHVR